MRQLRRVRKPLRGRDDICSYLQVSVRTFYRLLHEGLPVRDLCGLTAIPDELDAYILHRPIRRKS